MNLYFCTNSMTCGWGPQIASGLRTDYVIRDWWFQLHPQPPGWEERLETQLISSRQWFSQSCLNDETSTKTLNNKLWRAFGLVNTSTCQKDGAPPLQWLEAPALERLPDLTLCTSSPGSSSVSFIISLIITQLL